ncbi:Hypothetical_protein [Hexamita inflata]|uniref:Hypothetical_protein n=1 Tax=Hexamita inflata TaxID=28002 RepID=A0AA86QKB6_9EUKA|nr:Hypothetical protein HINF_LOCUS47548 [Hexamita inflata]CAI9959905.1 Hypothetical protein HINF_LOCUS47550 [Hexamita inflata]
MSGVVYQKLILKVNNLLLTVSSENSCSTRLMIRSLSTQTFNSINSICNLETFLHRICKSKMTKSKNFLRDTRKEIKINEQMSIQVDDTVHKPGYTLLGRRRMDNTAFQYMINWVFNNVRDTPIPEICELCKNHTRKAANKIVKKSTS